MLELNQTGLTDQIIEPLGLYLGTTRVKWTPAEATLLVEYKDG